MQRDAIKRAKRRELYEEQAAGKNTVRPQLEASLKSLREGDKLASGLETRPVGEELSRPGASGRRLEQRKINFESLTKKIETGIARSTLYRAILKPAVS